MAVELRRQTGSGIKKTCQEGEAATKLGAGPWIWAWGLASRDQSKSYLEGKTRNQTP